MWVLVYIISNQLYGSDAYGIELDQLLLASGVILNRLNSNTAHAIFDRESAPMKGVWDAILSTLSSRLQHTAFWKAQGSAVRDGLNDPMFRSFFGSFLKAVLSTQSRWIDDAGPVPGILCTGMGMHELAKKLLLAHYSYEPSYVQKQVIFRAYQFATRTGALHCATYLAQHCSLVNKDDSDQDLLSFIMSNLLSNLAFSEYDEIERERVLHSLKILLLFGANPGRPFQFQFRSRSVDERTMLLYRDSVFQTWGLSILDASFYMCNQVFETIYESKGHFINPSVISRIQVCTVLEQGGATLEDYLLSLKLCSVEEQRRYMELLLLEQFTFLDHPRGAHLSKAHARIARQLFEYGLDTPALPGEIETVDFMLLTCVYSLDEYGNTDDLDFIFEHLLDKQPKVTSVLLLSSIQEAGVAILSRLLRIWQGGDERFGGEALTRAAEYQNHEAVDWLLSRGVDINLELLSFRYCQTRTVFGHYIEDSERRCVDVVRNLIKSTPSSRYRSGDKDCSRLVLGVLRTWPIEYLVELVELFQNYLTEIDNMTESQWTGILRAVLGKKREDRGADEQTQSQYLQVFNHLARRYFLGGNEPILTYAILEGCSRELVDFLMEKGANVNEKEEVLQTPSPLYAAIETCDFDFAKWLIVRGAIIDEDAIRIACRLKSRSVKARRERMAFIQYLMGIGIDLKEAGAVSTAIAVGDVDLVRWLLKRGVEIDGNLVEKDFYTVVCSNHEDSMAIIQVLVNHGADTTRFLAAFDAVRAWNFDLIRWLLERRVEIDENALQWVGEISVATRQDRQEKMALMQSLVERGANVNGGPLLMCISKGDIEATCFLLKQKANPNLAFLFSEGRRQSGSCHRFHLMTALDRAVFTGSLDMTKLLLKAGALSGQPGLMGYDDALEWAVTERLSAIAELIQQHVGQLEHSSNARTMRDNVISQAREYWEESFKEQAEKKHRKLERKGKEYIPPHMCECVLGACTNLLAYRYQYV